MIHANEVSEEGDARVYGTSHWDRIMSRAAKRVLVVAERIASSASFRGQPELTLVPHFLVEAVSIVPNGAWPGSCWPVLRGRLSGGRGLHGGQPGRAREPISTRLPKRREAAHA